VRLRDIIFDLDGTLTDSLGLCYAAFRDVFARHLNRSFTNEEVRAMFGPSEEGVLQRALPDRWQECLEEFLSFYQREHASYVQVFPGVHPLLDWLRGQEARIGVVTGKGPRSAAITLRELGLDKYVDSLKPGSPNGGVKPEAIRQVLAGWGASPEHVAYVGDVGADMRASIQAGTLPLGAGWAPGVNREALAAAGALRVFTSPEELRRWLAEEDEDAPLAPWNGGRIWLTRCPF